jgi:hypothetical protein
VIRRVNREYPNPFTGPTHRPKFTAHAESFKKQNFPAHANLADAIVGITF